MLSKPNTNFFSKNKLKKHLPYPKRILANTPHIATKSNFLMGAGIDIKIFPNNKENRTTRKGGENEKDVRENVC